MTPLNWEDILISRIIDRELIRGGNRRVFYIARKEYVRAKEISIEECYAFLRNRFTEEFMTVRNLAHANATVIFIDCSESFFNMIVRGDLS